jgi:Zn finger protein HypA/HybF involved in hydrogenase expression
MPMMPAASEVSPIALTKMTYRCPSCGSETVRISKNKGVIKAKGVMG